MNQEQKWENVARWRKLLPLARRNIQSGNFDVSIRVLEGYRNSLSGAAGSSGSSAGCVRASYRGEAVEDALSFCYNQLGHFDKAAKRYEEIGAPYAAAVAYKNARDYNSASRLFQKAADDYQGAKGYDFRLVRLSREGLESLGGLN
jgi:tetratricopeptide (TPR) repeat protein